jgi:hypothetical protein
VNRKSFYYDVLSIFFVYFLSLTMMINDVRSWHLSLDMEELGVVICIGVSKFE